MASALRGPGLARFGCTRRASRAASGRIWAVGRSLRRVISRTERLDHRTANDEDRIMALVLHRAADESVILTTPDGCRIEVMVKLIRERRGQGVPEARLIFDAPRNVTIERAEVSTD
jgi:sRNA-binding carbon storage regulator CsrA